MNWHHFCRHKYFLLCLGSCYSMSMKQSGVLAKLGLFRTSAYVVIHASLPTSIFYWPLSFQRRRNDLVFSSLSLSVPLLTSLFSVIMGETDGEAKVFNSQITGVQLGNLPPSPRGSIHLPPSQEPKPEALLQHSAGSRRGADTALTDLRSESGTP